LNARSVGRGVASACRSKSKNAASPVITAFRFFAKRRKQGESACVWSKKSLWLSVQMAKYKADVRLKSQDHLLISMSLQPANNFIAKFALKNVIPYPNNGYSFNTGKALSHASFHLTP
jgi:hypothetical protein